MHSRLQPAIRRMLLKTRSRLLSAYRSELFDQINFVQGVVDPRAVRPDQAPVNNQDKLQPVVEAELFDNKQDFLDFVTTVDNNAVLVDFAIRFERFLDLDGVFVIFDKIKDNLTNMGQYKRQAMQDYEKTKGSRSGLSVNPKSLVFLAYTDFIEDLDYLYFRKLVMKVLKAPEPEYHKLVILYKTLLDFDEGFMDHELNARIFKEVDPKAPRHEELIVETAAPNVLYYWLYMLSYQINELSGFSNAEYKKTASRLEELIAKNIDKLSDKTVILCVFISEELGAELKGFKRLILKSAEASIVSGVRQLDTRQKLQLAHILLRKKKTKSLLDLVLGYVSADLNGAAERVTLSSFTQLYELYSRSGSETFRQAAMKSFSLLDFLHEDYSKLFIARFYLSGLVELRLVNDVRLSFVADYLDSLAPEDYDVENFVFVYYRLTLYGYYSENFAKKYTEHIQSLFKGKTLLDSPKDVQSAGTYTEDVESMLLKVVWAYLVNQRKHQAQKGFSGLLEPAKRILAELGQRVANYQTSDNQLVEMVSQINAMAARLLQVDSSITVRLEPKAKRHGFRALAISIIAKADNVTYDPESGDSLVAVVNKSPVHLDIIDESYYMTKLDREGKLVLAETEILRLKAELDDNAEAPRVQVRFNELLLSDASLAQLVSNVAVLQLAPEALSNATLQKKVDRLVSGYQGVKIAVEPYSNKFKRYDEANDEYIVSSDSDYQ